MNRTGGTIVISIVLFAAACSGGGDTGEPTTTSVDTKTSTVAQSTTTSAASTTTSELVTTTTRYEPEDVAPGARPTSFVAEIAFDDEDPAWFHVDLETGTIQRPVEEDEGYILDPLVSPDGRYRLELMALSEHPRLTIEDFDNFLDETNGNGTTLESGSEAARKTFDYWRIPALIDVESSDIVRWYNDTLNGGHPWSYCGSSVAWCGYQLFSRTGPNYIHWSWGYEGSVPMLSPVDSDDLFDGVSLWSGEFDWLHPVEQSSGNVVVMVAPYAESDPDEPWVVELEPPYTGAVINPETGEQLASFAIGDGETYILDLDYDESGTWLLATLDNSVEWQGGGQKDFVTIIDPEGRDFYVSSALW